MKKSLFFGVLPCLALSLLACDKNPESDNGDDDDNGTGDDADNDDGSDAADGVDSSGENGTDGSDDGSGGDTAETDDSDGTETGTGDSGNTGDSGGTGDSGSTGDSGNTGDDGESADGGPDIGDVECDIWAQDCPEGTKCMPWAADGGNSWNAVKCTPLDPVPGEVGDTCTVEGSGVTGIDDCAEGAMCWGVDPNTNMGTCTAMCVGSPAEPSCEDASKVCSISNNGALILCLPGCDPLLQDCDGDDLCLLAPSETGFICVIDASTAGEGNPGDACELTNVCQAGNGCISGALVPGCESNSCCAEYCDVNEANTCALMAEGSQCVAIWEQGEGLPEWEHVGYCQIPN